MSIVVAVVATVLLVPALVVAALVDVLRWLVRRRPWMATRMVLFGWVYVANANIGLVLLSGAWILAGFGASRRRLQSSAYWIQLWWARNLFGAFRRIFRVAIDVEGDEVATPGPIVLLLRHASIADVLLPNVLVTRRHGLLLRYVLKRELLVDPSLDVAGNRMPNHFVDRDGDTAAEVARVAALTEDLGPDDGVIIYPEGTRFTEAKQARVLERLRSRGSQLAARAARLRHVLPPRLGGPLVLLDAGVDVVVMAHTGLEPLGRVKDAWRGDIVGSTVSVGMWRVPASEVPGDRVGRVRFLFEQWERVDAWIAARR